MSDIIRLRDLPGVREVEAALHVPGRQLIKHFDDLDERGEDLARRLFGVADVDTHLIFEPKDFLPGYDGKVGSLLPDAEDRWRDWEEHFEILYWVWEYERDAWLEAGWDVAETNGQRLACMRYFGRPLVCVVDELLPEAVLALDGSNPGSSVKHWGNSLERAAEQFLANRGKRRR